MKPIDKQLSGGFRASELQCITGDSRGSSVYGYPQRQMDLSIKHLQGYVDNFKEELLTPAHTWKTQSRFKQPLK